ncbi:oligosaccharide flippase family protein [Candidatus Enterococcus mansonii]|uniref:Polysaccharide biosynthesis protein C-terminal domain-containing protein n=2 Tax=Candidatus Enterococcus mansonii TaxID=1834181 RepID=A0ABU8ICH0_9ENTE
MRKALSNLFYQLIFQLAKIAIPVVTVPIVSKALGPSGVGVYNYTNSIAQYVIIASGLGITLYGNREIAQARDSMIDKSKVFWDLVLLKAIVTISLLTAYLYFSSFSNDRLLYYAQGLSILSVLFDISWFFMGIEDFKRVTLISVFFQILTLVAIVKFINSSGDVLIYILIQASGLLMSQYAVWFFIIKKVVFIKPSFSSMLFHLRRSLGYFIPQVAVLLYTNLNKTILGIFTDNDNVAFYSNAQTINTMIILLITTLDTVLLPKMSYLSAKENKKHMLIIIKKAIHIQLFFSIAAMFGLISICQTLVPWFFGTDFIFLNKLIPIFSPLIVVVPLGMAISRQYLLPTGNIKEYNTSVIIGAMISVLLNVITIHSLGIYSAVLATILSEFFVTVSRLYSFVKKESFTFEYLLIFKYFFCGMLMMLGIVFLTSYLNLSNSMMSNIIQIGFGLSLYFIFTGVLKVNPIIELGKGVVYERKK